MKKMLAIVLACLMILSLTGCAELVSGIKDLVAPGTEPLETLPTLAVPTTEPMETTPASEPVESVPATEPSGTAPATEPAETTPPATEPAQKDPEPPKETLKPVEPPKPEVSVEELWSEIHGCWTDGDERFVWFHYDSNGPAFLSGTWESNIPHRRSAASVTEITRDGERYIITLEYPPVEGDAADSQDLRPMTEYLEILTDSYEETHMIQVMAPQDKYRSYAWVASNYEEAVDETTSTDYATYPEMVEFWGKLEGYWNAGDNRFIHFTLDAEGNPQMYCGIWYAGGGRGYGTLEKAMSSAKGDVVTFAMWYPGLDEDHMDGPMPEMNQVVSINMTEHRYMMLQVKLDDGPWEYYYWGGFEAEDAMP